MHGSSSLPPPTGTKRIKKRLNKAMELWLGLFDFSVVL